MFTLYRHETDGQIEISGYNPSTCIITLRNAHVSYLMLTSNYTYKLLDVNFRLLDFRNYTSTT